MVVSSTAWQQIDKVASTQSTYEREVQAQQEKIEREAKIARQRIAKQEAQKKHEREIAIQDKAEREKGEQRKISHWKEYYISKASYFNASNKIFKVGDTPIQVVQTLERRAKSNSGGASEKTLQFYHLSSDRMAKAPFLLQTHQTLLFPPRKLR